MLERKTRATTLPFALFGGLVMALAALLVAFIATSRLADRQFDLARLSERQATTVTHLAALIDGGADRSVLLRHLDQITSLIESEQRLTGDGDNDRGRVADELEQVSQLRELALDPGQGLAFRHLATVIDRREAREVDQARLRLGQLHRRATGLAALLAGLVLACAGAGGWLLARRNRVLQDEVLTRARQVEAIDSSRRLFFAKISHELRTPVQAMRSQAEITLTLPDQTPATLREALQHVVAGTVSLGHRIDELLGLASADNGQLQLHRRVTDLCAVLDAAVAECQSVARSVDCTIALVRPDEAIPILADPRWLRQALVAVIENGLKFSPMGQPLQVELASTGQAATVLIRDRGPGVVEADLPRIFDAYYQAETGRSRGGNGLGLALARWVVEQHRGTIGASNLAAGGCEVRFALPIEASS